MGALVDPRKADQLGVYTTDTRPDDVMVRFVKFKDSPTRIDWVAKLHLTRAQARVLRDDLALLFA